MFMHSHFQMPVKRHDTLASAMHHVDSVAHICCQDEHAATAAFHGSALAGVKCISSAM